MTSNADRARPPRRLSTLPLPTHISEKLQDCNYNADHSLNHVISVPECDQQKACNSSIKHISNHIVVMKASTCMVATYATMVAVSDGKLGTPF